MLLDGGLIVVKDESEDQYIGINLTWDGQDFVTAAKDEP